MLEGFDERVLVLAPTARDAATSRSLLEAAGVGCFPCASVGEVCREASRGAGAIVITAEAVLGDEYDGHLAACLKDQPQWSDLPVIILTPPGAESPKFLNALNAVGHATLMKRPVQVPVLVSAIRAAVRDRHRQYAVRDLIAERERAAETLRVERERYHVTLSSIGDAVIATDTESRVTFLNGVAEKLTGWDAEAARGRDLGEVFRIVNETTRQTVEDPTRRALREGTIVGLANRTVVIARDGTERPIDDSAAPIKFADGVVAGVVLVFRDIAERKKAEAALRESERHLREFADTAPVMLWETDPSGSCTFLSREWYEVTGQTEAESLGIGWTDATHPDDKAMVADIFLAANARREHFRCEYRLWGQGGAYRWALDVGRPRYGPAGEFLGMVGAVVDIHDRKLAEEARRVGEERLELVRRSSGVGFWYCDLPFDVLEWDGRVKTHFHLPADAHVTIDTFYDRIHPDDRGPTRRAIETSIANREPYDVLYRTVHPATGEEKTIRAIGRTDYDYDGLPVRFDGVTLDVTEQRRAEESLREADRRKDEFLATLAHELRNPLAPIRTGVQVLKATPGEDETVRTLAMMERQAGHLAHLVDDLMDVARVTSGKIKLRTDRVDLKAAIRSAVEAARPSIEGSRHALDLRLPGEPLTVDGDVTRLGQVLTNLLTNAAKYTEPGGRIEVTAAKEGNEVVTRVSDTGIGIPPEMLPKVFDMFAQVGSSLERSQGGLGIGLTLVRRLVEMHGGTVDVESEGADKGSTFTVRLPLARDNASKRGDGHGTTAARQTAPKATTALKVLVVDDNKDGATSLALLLKLSGHTSMTAYTGPDGIEMASVFQPDVIFLDIGLPGMSGYEVAQKLRENEALKTTTVVALTGWGSEEDRRKSKEAGFDDHLTKPVDIEDVKRVLAAVRK